MENDFDLANFDGDIFEDFTKDTVKLASKKPQKRIPVVMISGFLGSGKTTLLNNILRNSPELKIGAIVNDFGKINVDNRLVSGTFRENQIDLSNGCVCCMLGDNGLREPLDQLANENSQLDAIVLEASGIAEPFDLMNTLRFSGNEFTFFGGNIYVIDAQNFQQAQHDFPTHFKKCLQTADIFLINKTDLATPEQIAEIHDLIRSLNTRALIFESQNSQIDPRILFENLTENSKTPEPIFENSAASHTSHHHHHSHAEHLHAQFQSISFEIEKPLDTKKFIDFLDNLPTNLFRAKGFCYFGLKGYEQKYVLQIVGKMVEIHAEEWQENETPKTELVLIGAEMDCEKIEAQLREIIDSNPAEITPENMMNFERFML
ncbi:MAG: GTP-binding protein [bacterium]|nr:GTP-binding protein [bacterium]